MKRGRAGADAGTQRTSVGALLSEVERTFRTARLAYGHGTHNARDEAAWLVTHVLGVPHEALGAALEAPVSEQKAVRIRRLARLRVEERVPLAYLLREAWLGPHRFYVDRRVIVPRSFIAELLPQGLAPWLSRPPRRMLDLCTGSGCLAILAALAWPKAAVDAVDLSKGALQVARRNVADHRLDERVRLLHGDLFDGLRGKYDLVLSNPPYVRARTMASLPAEYRHEPALALAGGADGLDLVRRIVAQAPLHLERRGLVVLEIGHNRQALERAFPTLPFTWLETSAATDYVCAIGATELGSLAAGRHRSTQGHQ